MKEIIAKTKEIEKDLPAKPESLIDAEIIWTYPSGEKARLIKHYHSIQIGIINNMRVRESIPLDDSLLDDDGLLFLPSPVNSK